jgi:hypothetical protein
VHQSGGGFEFGKVEHVIVLHAQFTPTPPLSGNA